MGRPLGGKTLFKKYRLGELDLSELGNNSLLLLIEEQEKEAYSLKEEIADLKGDVRYTVNQKNKSKYRMASEMGIGLQSNGAQVKLTAIRAAKEIVSMLEGFSDQGERGINLVKDNYTFIYKK